MKKLFAIVSIMAAGLSLASTNTVTNTIIRMASEPYVTNRLQGYVATNGPADSVTVEWGDIGRERTTLAHALDEYGQFRYSTGQWISGHNTAYNPHGAAMPEDLEALSTNRATKVWNDAGTQYIDGTGGVWRIEQTTNLDTTRMLFIFSDGATIGGETPPAGITLARGESVETNGITYYWYANSIGVTHAPSGWARNINVSAPTNLPTIGPMTFGVCSNVYAYALEPVPYPRVAFVSDLTTPILSAVVAAGGSATNPVTLTITNTTKYTGLTVTARGAESLGISAQSVGLAVLGKSTDGNGVSGTALGSGYGVTASGATGILAVASTTDIGIYTPNKVVSGSGFVGNGSGITNIPAAGITGLVAYPTNYVAGFALPWPGTNALYTLSVSSNGTLSVWSVTP